jgi:hypothetical protein
MITTRSWIVLALGLLSAPWAVAQEAPIRLDSYGGTRVPAHYVRLEGNGSNGGYKVLKGHQQLCQRHGKPVEMPAEGEPIAKVTREDYYTPTHLIEYTRTKLFLITRDCTSGWQDHRSELRIRSPYGNCSLFLMQRRARGRCDGSTQGTMTQLPQVPLEGLGMDKAKNCIRTATEIHGVRTVHCVEPQPQPWRSFLYRAGGNRSGILIADRRTYVASGVVAIDIEAVEIRKNTTIGSDVLTLARTLGFTIISTAPDAE